MKFKITEIPVKYNNGWKEFYYYKFEFKVERAEWWAFLLNKIGEEDLIFHTKEQAEHYIHAQLNPTYYP